MLVSRSCISLWYSMCIHLVRRKCLLYHINAMGTIEYIQTSNRLISLCLRERVLRSDHHSMDSTIARPVIMEKDNPAIFDWDQSVMLLSAITQSLLFGMILVEASQYWLGYDRDSLRKKAYVALVCLCTLLQTAIENAKAWWVLVLGEVVTDIPVYTFSLALNGVVIALCEAFFIRRCWKVTGGSPWVLYPLSFGLIIITTAIIYYSINVHIGMDAIKRAAAMGNKISPWEHSGALRNGYNIAINVFIWGTLVIDSFVAIITTYHLSKQKIGLPASDSIVQTLMYFVWQTAVLPQLCMITAGGLFHAETHNKRYSLIVLFVTLAGKIYVYMVIWTLNHRDALRKRFTSLGEDTLDRFRWERGCTPSVEDVPNSVKLAANHGNSESLLKHDAVTRTAVEDPRLLSTPNLIDQESRLTRAIQSFT